MNHDDAISESSLPSLYYISLDSDLKLKMLALCDSIFSLRSLVRLFSQCFLFVQVRVASETGPEATKEVVSVKCHKVI